MTQAAPSIWQERGLVGFMAASLISNLGNWMQIFSEQWLTLLLSGDQAARWAGRLGFASGLAVLVFVPLGGVLADRVDRRRALALTQLWLMGLALAMGLLAWRGHLGLHGLMAFALATGFGSALTMPLMHSLVGDLVPAERIPAAMGVMSVQFNLSRMVGPTVAALCFPLIGASGNFLLNALTFVPLIWICGRLRSTQALGTPPETATYREGWRAFRSDPALRRLLVLAALSGLFAWTYFPLLPVYGARHLHVGARGVASLLATFGLGAVVGALGVTRESAGVDRHRRVLLGLGGFGLGLLVLGLHPSYPAALAVFFAMGVAQATFLSLMGGLVQQGAPAHVKGRVNALYLMAIIGITPIGTLLGGEAAQLLGPHGPRWVLGCDGLVLVLGALWARHKPEGP